MWVGIYLIIMDWIGLGHKVGGLDWIGFRKLNPRPTLSAPQERCWVCSQPFGGPCSWQPTGATPALFLPVVAVVRQP